MPLLTTGRAAAGLARRSVAESTSHHAADAAAANTVDAAAARDLRNPADWFAEARARRRTIHVHCGPTNSGKTHSALKALKEAGSGVYCGPLRLLAWEVHERLNADGVACNLLTGQEIREMAGAAHTACTVEMVQVERRVDVLVLDEVQMLGHTERGGAWSRALLGTQAAEVHVCGSLDAVPLVRRLAQLCGDEVVEHRYERLAPLRIEESSLGGDVSLIRRGDCVVAFSRRQLYALKAEIEASTAQSCCIVYGSLPPETRRAQAELFNADDGGHDVLVASDAVGMGLNLHIGRVVFASVDKFDGEATRALTPAEAQQIAGRAGRYQSKYGEGRVACLHARDLPTLRACLAAPLPPLEAAGLTPTFEQLQRFRRAGFPAERPPPFAELLRRFERGARVDGAFFCCSLEAAQKLADVVEEAPLSLRQRHALCQTPLDVPDDTRHTAVLEQWAWSVASGQRIKVHRHFAQPRRARSHAELADLESYHRLLDAYLWLSLKFPANFVQPEVAAAFQTRSAAYISDALATLPPPTTRRGRAAAAARTVMGTGQRPLSESQIAKRTAVRRQRRRNKQAVVFFD